MKIYIKVSLFFILIVLLLMTLYGALLFIRSGQRITAALDATIAEATERLSYTLVDPMDKRNPRQVERLIEIEMAQNPDIIAITVSDGNGITGKTRIGEELVPYNQLKHPALLKEAYKNSNLKVEKVDDDARENGKTTNLGTVMLFVTDKNLKQRLTEELISTVTRILLLTIFIGLTQFFILRRLVTAPLYGVMGKIREFAEGRGDLTRKLEVKTRDEVGLLAEAFNNFVEKLQEIVSHVKISVTRNNEAGKIMEKTTREISAFVMTVNASITQVNERITSLDENIRRISLFIKDIIQKIQNQNTYVTSQTNHVHEAGHFIDDIVADLIKIEEIIASRKNSTEKLKNAVKEGGDKLSDTREVIREINNNVDAIGELINMIDTVAGQTNLLAMNAAIEAAHAGKDGRGFGVIADEIRQLSEDTASGSQDIEAALNNIVEKINLSSQNSEKAEEAFSNINNDVVVVSRSLEEIRQSTGEVSALGHRIQEKMKEVNRISGQVNAGSRDISTDTDKMSLSIDEIAGASREVLQGMEDIAGVSESIQDIMDKLTFQMKALGQSTESLSQEIGQFKTGEEPQQTS